MAKKTKLSVGKREELTGIMKDFRAEAEEGNKPAFVRMTQNERFKIGLQWNHDDKSYNEAKGKFALTVNEVLPIVLDIAGTQEENPLDYTVRNVKGGTQTIAEILSSLAKNVMDTSMGQEESSRAFESGVTTARGFLQLEINSDNDPVNGDIRIEELDPFMVLPDPTCKTYDYNAKKGGAKYIIVDSWEDKDSVLARYPGMKAQIKDASFDAQPKGMFGRFSGMMGHLFGGGGPNLHLKDDYRHFDEHTFTEEMENNTSKQKNNFRISTFWWKKWKKGVYVQKLDDPLNYLAITDSRDIAAAKREAETNENIRVIDKDRDENPIVIATMNKTTMIGDVLLEHIEDPYDGMNLYTIVRFAPYFDHGYEYPPVQNLIGPQKLINFTFSSLVNLVKGLSNSGYKIQKGTQAQQEWLEDHGAEDGLVINEKHYGKVTKIEPNPYPVGFDLLTERGKQNMKEITQVNLSQPVSPRPESGKAKQIDEIRTNRTKGIIFRNWRQTNVLLANVLIEIIRNTNIFSNDEIMAIIDEEDLIDAKILDSAIGIVMTQVQQQGIQQPPEPEEINPIMMQNADPGEQVALMALFKKETADLKAFNDQIEQAAIPIAKEIMLDLIRKMQAGRYGIKVDTSPMSPTLRLSARLEILALHESLVNSGQPGISREKLIETSDVPNKEAIIADVPVAQTAEVA